MARITKKKCHSQGGTWYQGKCILPKHVLRGKRLKALKRDLRPIDKEILMTLYEIRDYKAGQYEAKSDLKATLPRYSPSQIDYSIKRLEKRGDVTRITTGVYGITMRGVDTLKQDAAFNYERYAKERKRIGEALKRKGLYKAVERDEEGNVIIKKE